ncbi:MAG: Ig-like domain-containing protein [Clostridia bacterium]|nr:Ig-like domain-containing protein [Clostridia bacterium]
MMKKRYVALLALWLLCLVLPAQAAQNVCKFDRTVTTFFEGETLQTSLILEGVPATGTVTYTTNAAHNATVDANGLVTGVSKGYATITATVKTEKQTFKANIQLNVLRKVQEITVKEDRLPVFMPTDPEVKELLSVFSLHKVLVLRKGVTQAIQATCTPKDANDRKFTITSSNEEIVRVSGSNLQPKATGECMITVASKQNPEVYVQYRVLVVQPVTKLKITADSKSTYVDGQLQLSVQYTPDNASIQAVTWTSSNPKAATVDENGLVTGVGKGTASIKATAKDGSGRYATFSVTVMQQPQSITLKETDISVNMGSSKTLQATVLPKNANSKKVTWTSSDESVAKVSTSGRVTPVGPGKCTIMCQSQEFPAIFAAANVTVKQLVTKITFAEKEVSLPVNTSMQVFWEVSPQNATDQSVTFSSNKESIATVDANGLITGHKRGECYITVKAADGSKKQARIKVSVLQPVEGVHMKNDTLSVGVDESITATAVLEPSDASNNRMTWYSADPSIATVKGSRNKPTITGWRWGTTSITGVTEDGGYVTTATINVGNYDKALKITDLYISDNRIKIVVNNESNMNITRFYYTIACYDYLGNPVPCTTYGGHAFEGSYRYTLYEGDNTEHGRFSFHDFVQPETPIAHVTMQITGYRTDDGYSRDIRGDRQIVVEFKTAAYVGQPEVTDVPAEAPLQ